MEKLKGRDIKLFDIVLMDDRNKWNIGAKAVRILSNGGKHPDNEYMPAHIGIVIEENDEINEIKVIQASIDGVKIKKLGLWASNKDCNLVVRRYKSTITDIQKRKLKSWTYSKLGLGYDYLSFLFIFVRYILIDGVENPIIKKIIQHFPNFLQNKLRYSCSEFVWEAWHNCLGVNIWTNIYPSDISPYDELRSKRFKTIGRHYNFEYPYFPKFKNEEPFPGMKRGDLILLYYKYDPIGFLIRRKTHSNWNHIGVALNETTMIDLRATKLRITHINDFLNSPIYKIKVLRIHNLPDEAREHLIDMLYAQPKKRIYWKMLWKFFLLFFNIPSDIVISCSEVIVKGLLEKGIDLVPGKDVRLVTPEDINRSKLVYTIWQYLNFM